MNAALWFAVTVVFAAALSYLSGFVGEALRGWREGRQEVLSRRAAWTTIEPPRSFPPPPGMIIEYTGCEHAYAKTLQRDVSPRGMSETRWCGDCRSLYEHSIVGRFRVGPRWTEPKKPEQKW